MKFCIPTIGSRITIQDDLKLDITPWHSSGFAQYKCCEKVLKEQTDYQKRNFTYYEVLRQTFVIPKGSILKVEGITSGSKRNTKVQMHLSISETSLEEEPKRINTRCSYRQFLKPRKEVAKFWLSQDQFNNIEFEFAV